jgi:hypothetical protein
MAIPGNVGGKKSTFSSPAAMAQAQRSAESQSMKALQDRREQTRQDFFKGRQDVSNKRLDNRQIQDDLLEKYKQDLVRQGKYMKTASGEPVRTASGDYVYTASSYFDTDSSSPTFGRHVTYGVNDKMEELSRKYGPTFREIGSDIKYGLGSMAKGAGDFIGKGGVIGSVLSGLYDKFKSGTQQGIETVGGLYDNLRKTLGGGEPPIASYGGSSDIRVTEQPMFPYNFETMIKPKPQPLQPSDMSQEQFMESFPELYSSLYQPRNYEPIKVSDMDMTGVTAQEGDRPVLPENVIPRTRSVYPLPNNVVPMTPVLPPEVIDPRMYQGQTLYAQNLGLPSLKQSYDFLRNPQVETPLGNLRFDNVLSGNPQLGYGNTIMINGVPVDLNATIGNQGLSVGGSFSFKKGGSVDKYAGLGYKLK